LDNGKPYTTSEPTEVRFRMNPNGVMYSDINDFVFTGQTAVTKGLGTDPVAPISIDNDRSSLVNGVLTLTVKKDKELKLKDGVEFDIVSLKATLADKALTSAEKEAKTCVAVYSDYVKTAQVNLDGAYLDIVKVDLSARYPIIKGDAENSAPITSFVYNGSLDLNKWVASGYKINGQGNYTGFTESKYSLHYRYEVMDYPLTSGNVTTNQKDFAYIDSDGHTLKAKVYDNLDPTVAAAGRTPLVKAELVDCNGVVVKRAFFKVAIKAQELPAVIVPTVEAQITLGCDGKEDILKVDAEMMNKYVYSVLGMSHEQAMNTYTPDPAINGITSEIDNKPFVKTVSVNGVFTTEVWWIIPHSQFGSLDIKNEFNASLRCVPIYPNADLRNIEFSFKVKVNKPSFNILGKNYAMWDAQHTAFKAVIPSLNYDPANCNYSSDLRSAFNTDAAGDVQFTPEGNVPGCGGLKFKIVSTNPATASLIKIVGNYIVFNHSTANAAALAELDKTTLYATVQPYYEWNGNTIKFETFNVQFIKPFSAFSVTTEKNFTDLTTGGSNIFYKDIDFTVKDYKDQVVNYLSPAWFFYGLGNYGLGYKDLDISSISTNLIETGGNLVPTEGKNNGNLPAGISITKESSPFGVYLKYLNTSSVAFTSPYKVFIHYKLPHFWGTLGTLGTIGNDGVLAIDVDNRPSVGTRK